MSVQISIIIPTLNAADALPETMDKLLEGVERGLIRELIVSDGGSEDKTHEIADAVGAELINGSPGRGAQMARGAKAAKGRWILFLHADTHLPDGWSRAVAAHIAHSDKAAAFRLHFRAKGLGPVFVALWANFRSRALGLPYGDQGLLIAGDLLKELGGYPELPLMEDVEIARKLRGKLVILPETASTAADRYLRDGWIRRGAQNLTLLLRYFAGADPAKLYSAYHKE